MPELGGKKFAMDFKEMLKAEVQKAVDESRRMVTDATRELTQELRQQGAGAASMIRAEARAVREQFSEITGNNPPDDEEQVVDKNPISQNTEGGPA